MNTHFKTILCVILISLCVSGGINSALARTLHVDTRQGNDRNEGSAEAPLKNIRTAVNRAEAGDTILLVPGQGLIHQTILIRNQSGSEGQPIIIEGNNNTLIGSRVVEPSEWEEVRPGLYRHPDLLKPFTKEGEAPPANMVKRFFLIVDDAPSRMGRSSKGARPGYPEPAALTPLQWSLSSEDGAIHFALDPEDNLENHRIEVPVLMNGLQTRGSCSHWIVRNLQVKHFMNDGFNFHGHSRNFLIENCQAEMCGDDGMSAHGDCHVEVDGFVARMNSTGICHINDSHSVNRNVVLEDNDSGNLFLLHTGSHRFESSQLSKRGGGIRLGPGETLRVDFENCSFDWDGNADSALPVRWQVRDGIEVHGGPES